MSRCKYCLIEGEWFGTAWGIGRYFFEYGITKDGLTCYVLHECKEIHKHKNNEQKKYNGPKTSDNVLSESLFIEDRVGDLKICTLKSGKKNKIVRWIANPILGEQVKIRDWDYKDLIDPELKDRNRLWKIIEIDK